MMFMDWKNQYSENEYTTLSNLQIQCNPYQAANSICHRPRTNNLTICMETQKTLNSQAILRKKNGTGGINLLDFRLYYRATVITTVCISFCSWLYHASTSAISVELSACTLILFSENMGFINLSSFWQTLRLGNPDSSSHACVPVTWWVTLKFPSH